MRAEEKQTSRCWAHAYGRDILNENGKLLLSFAEDNKLAFQNTFFCAPEVAYPTRFKAPTAVKDKHV